MRRSHALVVALASSISLVAGAAHAGDPASAQVLFNEARNQMKDGNFAKACPMLEESQRLDPGVGTQFNLADCYEHQGRTASSWALFLEVAATTKATGQSAREQAARARAAALAPHLSRLAIAVPTSHAEGLEVTRDRTVVAPALWGVAVPVDPGPHAVRVTAPGRKPWQSSVVIPADGTALALAVPELEPQSKAEAAEPTPPASATTSDTEPLATAPPATHESSASGGVGGQRIGALVAGGVGAVGLVVGSVAGIVALAKHDESDQGCSASNVCSASAGAARDSAIHAGNVSTGAFVVGLLAGAAGVVLWVTAPPTTPAASTSSASTASLGVVPGWWSAGGGVALTGGW